MEITKHEVRKISIDISTKGIPNYVIGTFIVPSADANFSIEVDIDGDIYAEVSKKNWSKGMIFTIRLDDPVITPLRSCKKKRIRKKWVKRYGLVAIFQNAKIVSACTKHIINNDLLSEFGKSIIGM